MKYEWRKQGKALYGARTAPALKTVPAQNYIKIDGRGDPNGADFSNRVGALYALAYAVKAAYKAASLQQEIDDFAVCPLEGVWAQISGDDLEKDKLEYTLMIRQPDFISGELVRQAQRRHAVEQPRQPRRDAVHGRGDRRDGIAVLRQIDEARQRRHVVG